MELMEYPQIKSIAIIAEGVPERASPRQFHFTQPSSFQTLIRKPART